MTEPANFDADSARIRSATAAAPETLTHLAGLLSELLPKHTTITRTRPSLFSIERRITAVNVTIGTSVFIANITRQGELGFEIVADETGS